MAGKFRAVAVTLDGRRFHSKREAARYLVLREMEKKGQIKGLEFQPRFPMIVAGQKVCDYVADFRYTEGGKVIVEDVKGVRTPVYRLKAKLMRALYGVVIRET